MVRARNRRLMMGQSPHARHEVEVWHMKSQTCSQCGTAFVLPDAPKPVDLLVSNRTFIPLEAYTKATCPHCGSREWATARIFFRNGGTARPGAPHRHRHRPVPGRRHLQHDDLTACRQVAFRTRGWRSRRSGRSFRRRSASRSANRLSSMRGWRTGRTSPAHRFFPCRGSSRP